MRWLIGLLLAFAVVIGANMVMIWFAVTTAEPISPSYEIEAR